MRDFATSRSVQGDRKATATIEFGAGRVTLRRGPGATLYHMQLRYDTERFRPLSEYTEASHSVRLGISSIGRTGVRVHGREHLAQDATVLLSPAVIFALDASLGAAEGDLDLGGLALSSLEINNGASRTVVRWREPNRTECGLAKFSSGAAELIVEQLGNSRCREFQFDGGVGSILLDWTGEWSSDAKARLHMALGGLTLRLPKNLGVRLEVERFLSQLDLPGFTKDENGAYVSAGYTGASHHLSIALSAALGDVKVEWK